MYESLSGLTGPVLKEVCIEYRWRYRVGQTGGFGRGRLQALTKHDYLRPPPGQPLARESADLRQDVATNEVDAVDLVQTVRRTQLDPSRTALDRLKDLTCHFRRRATESESAEQSIRQCLHGRLEVAD